MSRLEIPDADICAVQVQCRVHGSKTFIRVDRLCPTPGETVQITPLIQIVYNQMSSFSEEHNRIAGQKLDSTAIHVPFAAEFAHAPRLDIPHLKPIITERDEKAAIRAEGQAVFRARPALLDCPGVRIPDFNKPILKGVI